MIVYCPWGSSLEILEIPENRLSPKMYVRFHNFPKTTILCHIGDFRVHFVFSPSKHPETNPLRKKSYLAYI